jgi:hypothetical protein
MSDSGRRTTLILCLLAASCAHAAQPQTRTSQPGRVEAAVEPGAKDAEPKVAANPPAPSPAAGKPIRTTFVVRNGAVPEGWTLVSAFASTAFSKPATYYRHAYDDPKTCEALRYESGRITSLQDDRLASDLAQAAAGAPGGPLKSFSKYKVVVDDGSFSRGPFTFLLEIIDSGYLDAKGRRVRPPPGEGEGIGVCGPPYFTLVGEDASSLLVIDDVSLPFVAFDPNAVERWYRTEEGCKTDAKAVVPSHCGE